MFNAPRPTQRLGGPSPTAFGGSFVDENPLAGSGYDGLDPWSAAPSPTASPAPGHANSVFGAVIADATVPAIYMKAFLSVDPGNTGETSVSSLSRVLSTSSLPAATVDRIVNLVSSKPRVSKLEFFVALALVALAQSGKDVSIEQVAALSSQNTLPEPSLNLDSLPPPSGTSAFAIPTYRQNSGNVRSPVPAYAADDPWNSTTNTRFTNAPGPAFDGRSVLTNGASSLSGTGLPKDWWKRQESVAVTILGQQGFILNRYTVYQIKTDRGSPVTRRYSEFSYLWDCLTRRYPFRLFPALPPKRIGPDEYFLEQRRKGLTRCLNYVINHPIIKDDGLLSVFLVEPSFEEWRKNTPISLEEESATKRVDRVEEMSIPSDLEEKIALVRSKVSPLIDHWQRICILSERIIKRREAAAVRNTPAFFHRQNPSAHSSFPAVSPLLSGSIISPLLTESFIATFGLGVIDEQSDLSRLTNTLRAVVEVNDRCWRGDDCELSSGVRQGLEQLALHSQRQSELSEVRTSSLFDVTLEAIKSQRDLYIALRDLFIRHARLSIDQVERLKKRVETTSVKLDGVKTAQKEGWQEESERLVGAIERDQATIAAQLSRRIFIRACIWHELRVVLHNRENTLITNAVQDFARDELEFAENVVNNWVSLQESVESMPYE